MRTSAELIWVNEKGVEERIAKLVIEESAYYRMSDKNLYSIRINGKRQPVILLKFSGECTEDNILLLLHSNLPEQTAEAYIEEIYNFEVFQKLLG